MRVARVFMICAALISTFIDTESTRSNRQLQPPTKDHPPQTKPKNAINVSEITFTTLRPQMAPPRQRTYLSVYAGSHKKYVKLQPSLPIVLKPRSQNRFKGNRRRRQLQYSNSKAGRLEKSYKLSQNHVENHQIETMQGPAEAFDEGAIHIEPIYRITKNKNVLDMIANVFQRMMDPPKSVGPLVGPFHFPGVGDKVYVRLLETVQPDNLVIRLITRSPDAEIDSPFEKNVLPSSEATEQDIPLMDHEFFLPKEELISSQDQHSNVHSFSSDSSTSSTKNVAQASMLSSQKASFEYTNGRSKVASRLTHSSRPVYNLGTYKLNLKQGDLVGTQRVVRYNERHPPLASAANGYVNPGPRYQLVNKTRDGHSFRLPNLRGSFYPVNVSSTREVVRFKSLSNPEIVWSPQIPVSDGQEFYSKSNFSESTAGPKYSIEFASKKMKYLNMDGSVEPTIEDSSEKRHEDVELGPIFSNRSINRQWIPITGANNYTNEGMESSFGRKDEFSGINLEERTSEKKKRDSATLMAAQPREMAANKVATALETQESSCCLQDEEESGRSKSNFEEQRGEMLINSTSNEKSALGSESIVNPMLQLLQLHRVQRILKNSTETKRI
ncbi:unnamed protein product [Xylocopa violacea]|uniref:Uncharacterized protein n=1 Tax=Xylocopa violacea TaxID=135666 RepID=A0ABP1N3G2_XYLVO